MKKRREKVKTERKIQRNREMKENTPRGGW